MSGILKILILEDSTTDAEILQRFLKKEKNNLEFFLAMNKKDFLLALEQFHPDVILADNSLPQFNAAEALKIVRQRSAYIPFIMVTGTVSEEFAIGIIKAGADDYILKDRIARLPAAIDAALNQRKAEKEITDYKYALDQSAIVSIADQKGTILYANDNFCKISKYSKEELIGQDHRMVNSGYHPASYIKNLWKTIANGDIWHGEFRNKSKDGSIYWVQANIVPLLDNESKPYQYLAIQSDVTEQKKADEKLIASENRYRRLFESAKDGILILDADTGVINDVNPFMIEMLGYSSEEFHGKHLWEIGLFKDIVASKKSFIKLKQVGFVRYENMPLQTKTGTSIFVEFVSNVYDIGNGNKVIQCNIRDITERRKAEEQLSSNELRYRTLTSNAPVGIFQTDAEGKTIYVNETWMKFTGLSFNEAMGDRWMVALHPDDKEKQIKQWQDKSQNGLESSSEFRLVDKKGNIRWVIGKATPLFDDNHQVTGYIGTMSDITKGKKAEEKIQKSEEQYRDLVENITDLICTHDLDGRVLSVNSAAEELMGHKFNPNENLNIKDLLAPDKKVEFDLYIAALKKNGYAEGLMKVKTFSGKIHIWEYKNSLKTTGVSTPIVRGYARDITESRIAEENLKQSEARLKEAQSIAHVSNWQIDLVQNVHTWSDEFYNIYGINKDELKPSAEAFLSLMHPESADFAQKKIQEAFETFKESSFNFRFIRKNGRIRHGYSEWKFEFDKKGNPLRLYGILQDVTERIEAEEERINLELQLLEQQRKEQLTITATALEAQEKERNAIAIELHDNVNQIIVGTKLLLSTVRNTSDNDKDLVASCIENLQHAIDENRKIAHALVTPDLETDTLIDQISRLSHSMLETAGLKVHIDKSSYNENLLDKERKIAIYRIAQEQCTNIVKYAKAEIVTISLSTIDDIFIMTIADNGAGMQEGKKTTGIGIRNINSRLSVFHGNVNIITAPGKGFTLKIEIPL